MNDFTVAAGAILGSPRSFTSCASAFSAPGTFISFCFFYIRCKLRLGGLCVPLVSKSFLISGCLLPAHAPPPPPTPLPFPPFLAAAAPLPL